jgi:hypothetical protein
VLDGLNLEVEQLLQEILLPSGQSGG